LKYQLSDLNKKFNVQILILRFIIWTIYIHIHIYNFSTYIKIHPYVIIGYFRMQLIWWLLWLHINLLMDENKCKINPTNRMNFLIVTSYLWEWPKWLKFGLVVANISNLITNDYKSHVFVNGVVTFWLISTTVNNYFAISIWCWCVQSCHDYG
jgi:hypothetical protein